MRVWCVPAECFRAPRRDHQGPEVRIGHRGVLGRVEGVTTSHNLRSLRTNSLLLEKIVVVIVFARKMHDGLLNDVLYPLYLQHSLLSRCAAGTHHLYSSFGAGLAGQTPTLDA